MNKFFLKIFMALNTFAIRQPRPPRFPAWHADRPAAAQPRAQVRQGICHTDRLFLHGRFLLPDRFQLGQGSNAGWYYNLLAQPRTAIEVKGRTISVEARPAEGPQYDQLWKYAVQHHPPYLHYQEMTRRHIPIMILQPVAE